MYFIELQDAYLFYLSFIYSRLQNLNYVLYYVVPIGIMYIILIGTEISLWARLSVRQFFS